MSIFNAIPDFLRSSYEGIDHTLLGNGGLACYDFLTFQTRILDTCVFTGLCFVFIIPRVLRTISLPKEWEIISYCRKRTAQRICGFRKLLLIVLSIVLGIEMAYKLSKKSWIFLLNPCHVVTALQIYLLSAEPTRTCNAVFRVHIHLLFGPFLAILFPILNTRKRWGEQMIYYLQHLLIFFVVPPYLIHTGGAYRCEPIKDFSWALLSVPIFGFHMYYILQATGMLTLVNLNSMLCPAITDPFAGPNYRWFAMVHQTLLVLLFGKIYTLVVYAFLKIVKCSFKKGDADLKNNKSVLVDTMFPESAKTK